MRNIVIGMLCGLLVGVVSCKDEESSSLFDEAYDNQKEFLDFTCQCEVEAGEYASKAECLADYDDLLPDDDVRACAEGVLARYPDAKSIIVCQLQVVEDFGECQMAQGCPDYGDGEFMCDDGMTVPEFYVCDGGADCASGEDEANCPDPHVCGDGVEVPASWVCDGGEDCADGTDEVGCPETCFSAFEAGYEACGELPMGYVQEINDCYPKFTCGDGTEILEWSVCDGFEDCDDGSDEVGC